MAEEKKTSTLEEKVAPKKKAAPKKPAPKKAAPKKPAPKKAAPAPKPAPAPAPKVSKPSGYNVTVGVGSRVSDTLDRPGVVTNKGSRNLGNGNQVLVWVVALDEGGFREYQQHELKPA